jgi:RNA polymerase sigma-70 factor (ECF subfamily)
LEEPLGPRADAAAPGECPSFDAIYHEHFAFVWRSLRRLGVGADALDDALQDVFLVVHRRLGDFEGRSALRTWLFGIVRHVAADRRRAARRLRAAGLAGDPPEHELPAPSEASPALGAEHRQALRQLYAMLEQLSDERREVLILADLEGLSVPEIARSLGVNVNTVYTRLRAARRQFEDAVAALSDPADRRPRSSS